MRFDRRDLGWINSTEGFVRQLFNLREQIRNDKLWFRGQPDEAHELMPTVGRKYQYGGKWKYFSPKEERLLLHRFRRRAYPHEDRVLLAGEALFLARHYGLPTRLLDWTANALFGLYFAVVEKLDKDGALWAIRRAPECLNLDVFKLAELRSEDELFRLYPRDPKGARSHRSTLDAVKIVDPLYNSPRIVAQDGAFTFHSNPQHPLESYAGVSFRRKNLDIAALYQWRIAIKNKPKIIAQLSGLGITHRIAFPDLDGIARSVWETEVLWHGTQG